MIKNMLGSEDVGLYDAAVRISEVSYFIPSILISALFPPIIKAKKISDELYYSRIKKLLLLLLALSISIAALTTLLSKELILIIYGASFIGALPVLCIYVWSNIGETLNMLTQQILVTENLTKRTTLTVFLGMLVNVVLNYFWIPAYGISGAAFATLVAYMIPFLSVFIFKKTRHLMINILIHGK
jgi:O-antigen/teichoic acid export membrane protein